MNPIDDEKDFVGEWSLKATSVLLTVRKVHRFGQFASDFSHISCRRRKREKPQTCKLRREFLSEFESCNKAVEALSGSGLAKICIL